VALPEPNTESTALMMHYSTPDDAQAGVASRMYIIKGANARKHDSHGWFFSCCRSLEPNYIMMTDTGTLFEPNCLGRLVGRLQDEPRVIGTTARQRVMNAEMLKRIRPDITPLRWWLSPAPLQGFEFEATFVLNTALFNIVGALPVLPGPCQVLRWQDFKSYVAVWCVRSLAAD
jgi:cellulose synthase/poly-beta-1,6-N-acetylglucosamine synthase-like glycosyltransferase